MQSRIWIRVGEKRHQVNFFFSCRVAVNMCYLDWWLRLGAVPRGLKPSFAAAPVMHEMLLGKAPDLWQRQLLIILLQTTLEDL